jgi:hypothetical protein
MDQLKEIMAFCKKQQFWLLIGLCVVLSGVGYYLMRSDVTKQISQQKSKLDGLHANLQQITSKVSRHPNQNTHAKMEQKIDVLKEEVREAWKFQYEKQEPIFIWNEDALPTDRKAETLNTLNSLRPIEQKIDFPIKEDRLVSRTARKVYSRYIIDDFPRLASIIGAKWVSKEIAAPTGRGGSESGYGGSNAGMGLGGAGVSGGTSAPSGDMSGGSSRGRGGDTGVDMAQLLKDKLPTVVWSEESQQTLFQQICRWETEVPTTLEMCYSQEDIWILEAVLRIIANTNEGAVENFQAAIKEIEWIRIGRSAVGDVGTISGVQSRDSGLGGMGDYEDREDEGSRRAGRGRGGAKKKNSLLSKDPADGRYVDDSFQPVAAKKLRDALRSMAPQDAYFAVAKRVPVRVRFAKMDQRRIAKFLAECGNANIVFEARQVRMNTEAAPSTAGSSSYGGASGGRGGGGGLSGGLSMGGAMGSPAGPSGADDDGDYRDQMSGGSAMPTAESFDIPVEFYGVVYLYNPVDIDKLGIEKVEADTEIEKTVTKEETAGGDEETGAAVDPSATDTNAAAGNEPALPTTGGTTETPAGAAPAGESTGEAAAGGGSPTGNSSPPDVQSGTSATTTQ